METILTLTTFILAVFLGFEIITKVPPLLHTPLMSGSNAISGITIIGGILSAGLSTHPQSSQILIIQNYSLSHILGFFAIVFASINLVGGFLVTHRMLNKFRKKD